MNTIEVIRRPSIERAFREALSDPRSRGPVADALGWDDSQVSRFLSGNLGVPINKTRRTLCTTGACIKIRTRRRC